MIIEGECVVNSKEEHKMSGRQCSPSFGFWPKQHQLKNPESTKDDGRHLNDEQGIGSEYIAQWRENHEVHVEMISQEVFRYFFENGTVVPIQIGVIVNGVVVDAEIEGVGSEVVVVDERDGSEDEAEYTTHDEALDEWRFVLLGIQDDHIAGVCGNEDRKNC